LRGIAIYGLLARHQLLAAYRAFAERTNAYVRVILFVFALYLAYALAVAGWRFGQIAFYMLDIGVPTYLVNDYVLAVAFSLFGVRFLFGRSPRFRTTPYLHLPIRKRRLIHYFLVSSLFSLHNAFPLFFVVPLWMNEITRVNPFGGSGSWWLVGIVLVLMISTWLNAWLRALLSNRTRLFALLLVAGLGLLTVDQALGTFVVNDLSRRIFDALLARSPWAIVTLVSVTLLSYGLAVRQLDLSLHDITEPRRTSRRIGQHITLLQDLGPVGQMLVLELKMVWRNRRPQHNLLLSVVFSTVYVIALLLMPRIGDSIPVHAVVGLFASGGFALNYGQLMFGWESSYFDGLLSRDITTTTMVRAKYVLLQISCAVFFFLSLPIFILVQPELVPLHAAFALYNMGVTTVLIVLLAVFNSRRIELWRSGSFFNYEGFSFLHWVWIIPIALPAVAIMLAFPATPIYAVTIVGLTGILGMLLSPVFIGMLADWMYKRRYLMLSGFRSTR